MRGDTLLDKREDGTSVFVSYGTMCEHVCVCQHEDDIHLTSNLPKHPVYHQSLFRNAGPIPLFF